jgi:hypothetical protein
MHRDVPENRLGVTPLDSKIEVSDICSSSKPCQQEYGVITGIRWMLLSGSNQIAQVASSICDWSEVSTVLSSTAENQDSITDSNDYRRLLWFSTMIALVPYFRYPSSLGSAVARRPH